MSNALPSHKTCCQCATSLPASAFLPSSLSADGLTDRCKGCVFNNAARDRAERETRRASQRAVEPPRPILATGAAARGSKRRQRADLPPSAIERTATHG